LQCRNAKNAREYPRNMALNYTVKTAMTGDSLWINQIPHFTFSHSMLLHTHMKQSSLGEAMQFISGNSVHVSIKKHCTFAKHRTI
jgi:hypothetical protein